MVTFKLDWEKLVQAIDYIARKKPGMTQFYISKIIYLADKEHLLDYGRPISTDRIVAMKDGPVPSSTLNVVKLDSQRVPREALDLFTSRLETRIIDYYFTTYSRGKDDFSKLSGSDKEYLEQAVEKYGGMSFGDLWELVHDDPAYKSAWENRGEAGSIGMDITIWLAEFENSELAARQLAETAATG